VRALSKKPRVDPERVKEIQERSKERNIIVREIQNHGPSTIDELAKITGMEKWKLLRHLMAMRQFGKVAIVGQRENQFVYCLPEGSKS